VWNRENWKGGTRLVSRARGSQYEVYAMFAAGVSSQRPLIDVRRIKFPMTQAASWRMQQDAPESTEMRLKETPVVSTEKSLRLLIEKWTAPTPAMPLRVTRLVADGPISHAVFASRHCDRRVHLKCFSFNTMTAPGACFRLRASVRR
jgi:hypothetical protein